MLILLDNKHPFLLAEPCNDLAGVLFDYFEEIKFCGRVDFVVGNDQVQKIGLKGLKGLKETDNFVNECGFIDFIGDLFAIVSCIHDLFLQKQAVVSTVTMVCLACCHFFKEIREDFGQE